MFNKFMSAIFSTTKVEKDNSNQVIAAANLAPVATQTNSVNIDHTILTDEQLIEVAQALMAKKAAEAKVDATKAAEALELKQKQELLKVTNALAATTRKLRSVTESAAKTHEELLFQEIYLEEAQSDICAATNESEVVAEASAAMTKDDARALLAERRAQLAAQRNTAPKERSYTNNAGTGGSNQTEGKTAKRPIAHAALVAAGLSDARAKKVLDKTYFNNGKDLDSYVEYLIGNGEQAFVYQVAAIMCGDQGAYANRWKKHLAGAPATSTPSATVGFTSPASAGNTTTPSTEGNGISIPSGVGDTAEEIVDNTTQD